MKLHNPLGGIRAGRDVVARLPRRHDRVIPNKLKYWCDWNSRWEWAGTKRASKEKQGYHILLINATQGFSCVSSQGIGHFWTHDCWHIFDLLSIYYSSAHPYPPHTTITKVKLSSYVLYAHTHIHRNPSIGIKALLNAVCSERCAPQASESLAKLAR